MKTASISQFQGIDLRRALTMGDPRTARTAKNLVLTSGSVWRTRPGTRKVLDLPEETKGLYAAGGTLRAVAPTGNAALFAAQRPDFWFDFVEGAAPVDEFIAAEIYGVTGVTAGAQPYVVVRRGDRIEHHWCRSRPETPAANVQSRVPTGFTPTGGIIKLVRKIFAVANTIGQVRFSSTEFGPSDWATERDAGFIPVQQHSTGDIEVVGLSHFHNRLVVFFQDQIQLWAVDPEPANFYLVDILNGPGTLDPKLSTNVLGDLFFFSAGGFRALSSAIERDLTATTRESDIGAPIYDLVRPLRGQGTASVWWQDMGLYLAAFGERVVAFKYDPNNRVWGWSEWMLPFPVEHFAILGGRLFARSNNALYEISEDFDTDAGDVPIDWEWSSQFLHLKSHGRIKQFQSLQLAQEGTANVSLRPSSNDPERETPLGVAQGNTDTWRLIPMLTASHAPGLVLRGQGHWQLDGFTIQYNETGA